MKNEWRKSNKTLAGRPCIEHRLSLEPDIHETCLVGRYGQIWEYAPGRWSAMVHNHKVANNLRRALGFKPDYREGEEYVLNNFGEDLLPLILKTIKPFKERPAQIRAIESLTAPLISQKHPRTVALLDLESTISGQTTASVKTDL